MIAESTHWYDADGKPRYTVTGKNGKERATTLRDARAMNLYPSVTTIIKVAAAPGLENWKIDQALMAALTLPRLEGESLDDFMERAKKDAKEQAIKAAERGSAIHADIERGFKGIDSEAYRAVRAVLDEMFPGEEWIAESSFSCAIGYGGKIDLYSKNGIFVDFKTKDNLDPESLTVYDEQAMQLSAYALGIWVRGLGNPVRVSVFIDREDVSKVAVHAWDVESHEKHCKMFLNLLSYWRMSKNYFPGVS